MKTINLYFDFEFTSLSPDSQPISLGVVSDEHLIPKLKRDENDKVVPNVSINPSKSFYAEFSDFDINRCDDWVKKNVVRKLRFNNDTWGKNAFEESHTEIGSYHGSGPLASVKIMLKRWLSQFSDYQIQFVCDCGILDWYWMLQLLAVWDVKCIYPTDISFKTGLPTLPVNISPVPQDLNDLIALKRGISVKEAFYIERLGSFCQDNYELYNNIPQPHNALFDAKVIKATYEKIK